MTHRRKVIVFIAVLIGTFLSAIEATVVSTAMPTIIGTLGGISLYSWVFSSYLLTSTTTMPIYGKLCDQFGRKPVYVAGCSIFVVGSILCGLSTSMEQLIIFRGIQGIGAGALIPVTMTIVGDLFDLKARAKLQGVVSSVWGISGIIGPGIGALLVSYYSWPLIFLINVPIGALSAVLLLASLRERHAARARPQIDYWGAITLTAGVTALLLVSLEAGASYAWLSLQVAGLLLLAVVCLASFFVAERRAAQPILPFALFARNRTVWAASLSGFLIGVPFMGVASFVPLFAQGAMGGTAIEAAAVLMPLSISWPIASTLSATMIIYLGFRPVALLGTILVAAASALLTTLSPISGHGFIIVIMLIIGAGLGFCSISLLLAVQSAVEWGQRGVATASMPFFRSLGGTIGVTILGTLLNARFFSHMSGIVDNVDLHDAAVQANALLEPTLRSKLDPATLLSLQSALADSLLLVFWAMLVFALLAFVATFLLPPGRPARTPHPVPEPDT